MNTGIAPEDKRKILGVLKTLFPKGDIYLYGSRARGSHSKFSDIDLAIDMHKEIPLHATNEARSMLNESNIIYKMDVVDMHRIPEKMREHIKKEGILWT